MRIRAFLEREGRERAVKLGKGNVRDLLDKLGINPESVIVARDKDLLADCSPLKPGDRLKIIHIKASE